MAGDGMKERAANMQQRRVLEIGVATPQSFDHCVDEYGNVAIVVSRQEVEGCATGRVVAALMALTDTPGRVRRFADALWLSFDGYNDDARELWEIPEVVRYFAAVHASWPHWCHFMVKEPVAFSLVLTLLLQRAGLAGAGGTCLPLVANIDMLKGLLFELFEAMNTLYKAHGFSIAENKVMTERVIEAAMAGLNPE